MFENINICYVIFNLLYLFVILLYLKLKGVSFRKRLLVGGVYILVSIFSFSYMNSIVNSIFALKYLSVKTYLFLLVITNGIILYTMNHEVFLGYKVMNYLLFILLTIIFGANLAVVLGNKYEAFYLMDVKNAVNFIDLSLVIFLVYGVVIAVIFIGNYLFSNKVVLETKAPLKEKKELLLK